MIWYKQKAIYKDKIESVIFDVAAMNFIVNVTSVWDERFVKWIMCSSNTENSWTKESKAQFGFDQCFNT